jgi:MoxR-like ATPase
MTVEALRAETRKFKDTLDELSRELAKVIVGQDTVIDHVICGLVCGGHVLLE